MISAWPEPMDILPTEIERLPSHEERFRAVLKRLADTTPDQLRRKEQEYQEALPPHLKRGPKKMAAGT
jgi:hypothetical protein